jgi:hypothetical protein
MPSSPAEQHWHSRTTYSPAAGLPIGRHQGRFDLRASWLVSTRGVNDPTLGGRLGAVPTLRNRTIADIDLTASTARLNLDGCVMVCSTGLAAH